MPVATEKNLNETGFWTVATCEDPVPGCLGAMRRPHNVLLDQPGDGPQGASPEAGHRPPLHHPHHTPSAAKGT